MTIVETFLVYALIPAGIYGIIALITLRSKLAGTPRYRPGQPWEYPAMWWSGNPEGIGAHRQVNSGETSGTAVGGARGSW